MNFILVILTLLTISYLKPFKPNHVGIHSLDSSHRVLSDEYPYARASAIFQGFFHHFLLVTSIIRVNIGCFQTAEQCINGIAHCVLLQGGSTKIENTGYQEYVSLVNN